MRNNDVFATLRRTREEQYFYERELELIEKLRQRAEDDAGRRRLAERTGVVDQEILQDLQALGYTPDTLLLLHLTPLVQMAWADGSVSDRERQLIVEAARTRGVEEGSSADSQLEQWLATRPNDAVFDKTLRAIAAMLAAGPEASEAAERDLLSYCAAIAAASGGVLGFGRVSADERRLLARITTELERRAQGGDRASGIPLD